MRRRLLALMCAIVLAIPSLAAAQDTPVVFVHGFKADQNSWNTTAARLQQQLAIRPYVAQLDWREAFESQAAQLNAQFGSLPASTIGVGHSNGGLVLRQWNLQHALSGLVTVGTPNHGAPAVDNLHAILNFNQSLYNAVGLAGGAFSIDPSTWEFVYLWVQGALIFSRQIALDTVLGAVGLGLQAWLPVTGQMGTSSYVIGNLNSFGNLQREQAAIPRRAGLIFVARNYAMAGPMRAIDPDNADAYFNAMWSAIYVLEAVGTALSAYYPSNTTAMWIANSLMNVGGWLRRVDPVWCGIVTNDYSCGTWHDGLVPYGHQVLPGAVNIGVAGPAHIQESKEPGPIHYVLTNYLGVRSRGGSEIPPTSGGNDELTPGQTLHPGQFRRSADGRFELAFQGDGNLVLYRMSDGVPLWASGTAAVDGETAMQTDGNLVVYDAGGTPVWDSGTFNFPGAKLVVQSDGNVVIYDDNGFPIWATGTAR